MTRIELLQLRDKLPTAEEVRRNPWSFRIYQDANATKPVTRHGQPIGAMIRRGKKMNKKQRQQLRDNPLDWTPRLQEEALDCIEELEAKLDQPKASTPEPPPELSEESQPVFPFILEELRNAKRSAADANWLADLLEERRNFGLKKYGQELHTHNGRDAIEDARQELGDLVVYLTQASMEGRSKEVGDLLSKMRTIAACLRE